MLKLKLGTQSERVLGGSNAWGRLLGLQSTIMNSVSVLRRSLERTLSLFDHVRTPEKAPTCKPGNGSLARH